MLGNVVGKEMVKMENGTVLHHLYLTTDFSDYKKDQGAVGVCIGDIWTGLAVAKDIKVGDTIEAFYDRSGVDKDGKPRYKLAHLAVVKPK